MWAFDLPLWAFVLWGFVLWAFVRVGFSPTFARESAYLRQVNFYRIIILRGHVFMFGLSLGTCLSNLKSVALTVLELLAFNARKFRGSRDPGDFPFSKSF